MGGLNPLFDWLLSFIISKLLFREDKLEIPRKLSVPLKPRLSSWHNEIYGFSLNNYTSRPIRGIEEAINLWLFDADIFILLTLQALNSTVNRIHSIL